MKKLALSSLIAVFAVSGAHAANVIDGNPLYMPKANHFYSVTDLNSHTNKYPNGEKQINTWNLGEEFGYGITDKLTVLVKTVLSEDDSFDQAQWGEMSFGAAFRALDKGAWKLDVLGAYAVDPVWGDHMPFLKSGTDAQGTGTEYTWTAGVRGGYTTSRFTVAGKALFNYWNTESFNWDEDEGFQGVHYLTLGLDGQFVLCDKLNLVAGVEYTGYMDKEWRGVPGNKVKNAGTWDGTFGVNYNIDSTKFVGAYVSGSMNHQGGTKHDEWKADKGFGFGAKFGIDF